MSDDKRTRGGLSIKTLLIAGAASAAAAFVVPMFWRPGTVYAAAMTPVIVALVTELLNRPVETVSAVKVRRTARGAAILEPPPEEPFDPLAPPSTEELEVLPETSEAPRTVHRRPLSARQWKLALATGLVAFAAVAAVFTASELLAGDSISGSGTRTTFFGGAEKKRDQPAESSEERDERKEATPTPTPKATETPTPTPTPDATPTPTPTPTTEAEPAPAAPPPAEPTPTP